MKSRNILIALGVAAALAAGVGAYSYTAFAQGGPGYGPGMMGGGYGPSMMGGRRPRLWHMRGWGGGQGAGIRGIARPSAKTDADPGPPAQQGHTAPDKVTCAAGYRTCAVGAAVTAPA